ncbi:MAG: hypothetical protein KIH01_06390 [Candidatus Freyarchaeota archaeon]|nr:hypothetical protein [Candidatus Jordarchaeia archaeon]
MAGEEAGKFKQPWLGLLSLLTIYSVAFIMYIVFFNPIGGLLSRLVVMDAYVLHAVLPELGVGGELAALLAPALALRGATTVILNPLGYPLDWISVMVFGIVWFIVIGVLCRPFQVTAPPKQPRTGLITAALSLILAFLTFYVLGAMGFKGYEMLLLGTCGFLVFPIWATQLEYWPIVPKKATMHPLARGAIYTVISWIIAGILYWIFNSLAWGGATFFEMYLPGGDLFTTLLQPLAPFNHYDHWISLLVAVIAGFSIVGLVRPYEGRAQPIKGILNIITGIIIGVILWLALTPIIGTAPHVFEYYLGTTTAIGGLPAVDLVVPLTMSIRSPANVTALLLCIVLAILIIELPFKMHWFEGKGLKGRILALIVAVIVGVIVFLVVLGTPSMAMALSLTGAVAGASGLQTLAYYAWMGYAMLAEVVSTIPTLVLRYWLPPGVPADMAVPVLLMSGMSTFMEVQASMQQLAVSCVLGWFVLGGIMWLLIYESFNHWPWK